MTAAGGTSLAAGPGGHYEWETGWGGRAAHLTASGTGWAGLPGAFAGGAGGGTSPLFTQPGYQRTVVPAALSHAHGTAAPMRVVPDIAADADPFTGVQATGLPGSVFGGTSASCPLIAGLQADAQQAAGAPIGFANPAIYARYGTGAYHDVTDHPLGPTVRPDVVAVFSGPQPVILLVTLGMDLGLTATAGYDEVTGVGTPAPGYFASYRHQ